MTPGRPAGDEPERRIDTVRLLLEMKERECDLQRELHDLRTELAKRQQNGNGTPVLLKYLGIPAAIIASISIPVLYHNTFAVPSVQRASAEAVEKLLTSQAFWAQVKDVSRVEARDAAEARGAINAQRIDELRQRLEQTEQQVEETRRQVDAVKHGEKR